MNTYHTTLSKAGIRPSVQRVAVYSFLCEHPEHPTVETLFQELQPLYPTLSKTTIYNTLKLFESKHLVRTLKIEDDKLRFDADIHPHLHFKCEKCGKLFDIYDNSDLPSFISKCNNLIPESFSMEKIQINLWGTCDECSEKK
ncbi:MAG: transcriptional repressor [Treponema sp.]|nr:transcriptional repressor [Treponema sp.]